MESEADNTTSVEKSETNEQNRFLHTLGEARSIALVGVTDRSTERNLLL
jgi:hypothetical protein